VTVVVSEEPPAKPRKARSGAAVSVSHRPRRAAGAAPAAKKAPAKKRAATKTAAGATK
jgi:hypothetical protein